MSAQSRADVNGAMTRARPSTGRSDRRAEARGVFCDSCGAGGGILRESHYVELARFGI
jgi:hypothetical protein